MNKDKLKIKSVAKKMKRAFTLIELSVSIAILATAHLLQTLKLCRSCGQSPTN
jgi:prepilin-type N-terminal cleavage/methylation domain-containing protein